MIYLLTIGQVEDDCGLRIEPQLLVIFHLGLAGIIDHEVRLKVFQFLGRRLNEHVLYKVRLPGNLHDKADRHARILVGTAECINDKQTLAAQLIDSDLLHGIPGFLGSRVIVIGIVIGGPPYGILGFLIHHDKFILGRTSGVYTRHDIDGTQLTDLPHIISGEAGFGLFLKQSFIAGIVHNLCRTSDTILVQINFSHFQTSFYHSKCMIP